MRTASHSAPRSRAPYFEQPSSMGALMADRFPPEMKFPQIAEILIKAAPRMSRRLSETLLRLSPEQIEQAWNIARRLRNTQRGREREQEPGL